MVMPRNGVMLPLRRSRRGRGPALSSTILASRLTSRGFKEADADANISMLNGPWQTIHDSEVSSSHRLGLLLTSVRAQHQPGVAQHLLEPVAMLAACSHAVATGSSCTGRSAAHRALPALTVSSRWRSA